MPPLRSKLDRPGRATLRDVAAHAGVSKSTVSLVLRGSTLVADTTRARVHASIDEIGYVYNRGAATMRSMSTQTVGLIVPQIDNPFFGEFTVGVDDALDRAGFIAFLANTSENAGRQDRFLNRMREHGVDGVIVCPSAGSTSELVRRIQSWRMPCVQALRHVLVKRTDYVAPDYRFGSELATEHLVLLGHTRIAFIGGAFEMSVTRERRRGFTSVMRRHGLDEKAIFPCSSNFRGGAGAAREAFGSADRPTGAVCYNDIVAMGVTAGLRDMGLRPGHDVALTGFDDIAEASVWAPAMTTIAVNPRQIGEEAANLLMRRIADPNGTTERVTLPPRLIIRESSGYSIEGGAA
ncbi:MAG: LacI family DNA-binding transcriptional regulator [Rhodospirillales bacterium]|nr:LacI family DNA-binding transcriptional regulator [Rhodospirillales bacterium]